MHIYKACLGVLKYQMAYHPCDLLSYIELWVPWYAPLFSHCVLLHL